MQIFVSHGNFWICNVKVYVSMFKLNNLWLFYLIEFDVVIGNHTFVCILISVLFVEISEKISQFWIFSKVIFGKSTDFIFDFFFLVLHFKKRIKYFKIVFSSRIFCEKNTKKFKKRGIWNDFHTSTEKKISLGAFNGTNIYTRLMKKIACF